MVRLGNETGSSNGIGGGLGINVHLVYSQSLNKTELKNVVYYVPRVCRISLKSDKITINTKLCDTFGIYLRFFY